MMLSTGDQPRTISGRQCTPVPTLDATTDRKAHNAIRRLDSWLRDNAIAEAEAIGNDFAAMLHRAANPKKLTDAERGSMNLQLFGTAY